MDLGSWGGGKNQRLTGRVEPSDYIVGKVSVSIKQKKNHLTTTIKENANLPSI